MNPMSPRELQQHIMILGWLYAIGHALYLVIGVFVFLLLTGVGAASGDPTAVQVLGIVGTSVGLLLVVLGVPGLLAGYGLLQHRPWARALAIVVGMLGMVNIPVGTGIGIYTLWVLTQESAAEYFTAPATA